MHSYISIIIRSLIFSCLIIHSTVLVGSCEERTVVFKLQFRDASELLPIVKDMMSQTGRASMDVRTNSIILTDSNDSIQYIQGFLERLDKPLEQLTVRVRIQETTAVNNSSITARGRVSGENWEIKTHEQEEDAVHIRVDNTSGKKKPVSEFFLRVQSGSASYIMVGENILFTERWDSLLRKYGYTVEFAPTRIEHGLDVRPIIIGNHVDIEIIPRISHKTKRGEIETIRFTEASTYVTVNTGQWVVISGIGSASNEIIREILASGSARQNRSLTISLMVEK